MVRQAYTMIEALYNQATCRNDIAVVDTATYTSVAQKVGALTDNQIMSALSNVMSGITISVRPYTGKFRLIWATETEYGNYKLKVSFLDNAQAEANKAYQLADGQTLGQHTVKLPKMVELSIEDSTTIEAFITLARDQIKEALPNPDALERFFAGLMVQIKNELEMKKEAFSRSTVCNYIGGKLKLQTLTDDSTQADYTEKHQVKLLTEYNAAFGHSYTDVPAVCAAGKYSEFIEFSFAQVEKYARKLAEAGVNFHMNPRKLTNKAGTVIGGNITRHTSADNMKLIVLAEYMDDVPFLVRTNIHNQEFLKLLEHEEISYWQAAESPDEIKVSCKVMGVDGTTMTATENLSNVFAVMFDRNSLGIGIMDEHTGDTPYDVEKEAKNRYWKMRVKSWNDFTENGIVFTFD